MKSTIALALVALASSTAAQPFNFNAIENWPMRVMVKYKNNMGESAAKLSTNSVYHDFRQHNVVAMTVPNLAVVEAMLKNSNIVYVEHDPGRVPYGSHGGGGLRSSQKYAPEKKDYTLDMHRILQERVPYGIEMVQADAFFSSPLDEADIKTVCIIDSGYDTSHKDLPEATGSSVVDGGIWSEDVVGHGSHVAGTIGAIGNNGIGVVGVMPNATLHIINVFPGPDASASTIMAAVKVCAEDAHASVISMSLGGSESSQTEQDFYAAVYDEGKGPLIIAAAGNDGEDACGFPAGYPEVLSVGAVDQTMKLASFSTTNNQVELVGPGVDVLSTVPEGMELGISSCTVGGIEYPSTSMESVGCAFRKFLIDCGKAIGSGNHEDQDFGDCENSSSVYQKICLIERGNITFQNKTEFCESKGGVAAIIYNNEPGLFAGTLGNYSGIIPVVAISQEDGKAILDLDFNETKASVKVEILPSYSTMSGTSMATPHVSGVAALVWSFHPACNAIEIRKALQCSALSLASYLVPSNEFGYGLVQAKLANDTIGDNCTLNTSCDPAPMPTNLTCGGSEGGCAEVNETCVIENCDDWYGCNGNASSCCCCSGLNCTGNGNFSGACKEN